MSKNIIICYRSKYNVPTLNPLVPTYLLPVPFLNSIFSSGCSCATTHGPPLLSGFSSFLCVEQRAEQSNGAGATDRSDTPQKLWTEMGENTGESRGGGTAVSCSNPSRRWRTVSLEEAKFSFSVERDRSRHLLRPVGRRLQVSNSCRCCTTWRSKGFCCWVVRDFVPRLCRTDDESAERWWGGELHSGLMMGDVCGPALKSIQTTWAPHWITVRTFRGYEGGIKDTQMLQFYS